MITMAQKKYRQSEKGKTIAKEYRQTEISKAIHKKAMRKYQQSKKGKIAHLKANAKRKNLNWIPLFANPFNDIELIEWHHITNIYVVALPKDLHQLYYGKYHREKTTEIVNQIYSEVLRLQI